MTAILPIVRYSLFLSMLLSLFFLVELSAESKETNTAWGNTSFLIRYAEYDSLLSQALTLQLQCDSMRDQLLIQRNLYSACTQTDERQKLKSSIQILESSIRRCQEQADELFQKSQINQPEMASSGTKAPTQIILLEISRLVNNTLFYQFFPVHFQEGSDTSFAFRSNWQNNFTPETGNSYFVVMEKAPYSDKRPIPSLTILPEGLVYCIQLGVYSKSLAAESFGGMVPCWLELMEDSSKLTYFTGLFSSSKEAREALITVKERGFEDAFILPYMNGNKISIQEAREYEFSEKNLIR
ncbi:MAG: hypothetical protein IPM71_02950 [Bacteroidota bacterium]|nr:MAG: hypothetical protein IPM71_02950 [Bacteroidota bacterium]